MIGNLPKNKQVHQESCGRFENLVIIYIYINKNHINFEHLLQTTFLKYSAMHGYVSLYFRKRFKNEALTGYLAANQRDVLS